MIHEGKPFLKWAGGKTQLLPEIKKILPNSLHRVRFTFIEPFVGGGAFLFWMLRNYPNIEKAIINDINTDLTNTYLSIKHDTSELINILSKWENQYHRVYSSKEEAKLYFYEKRALFNARSSTQIEQAALFIFLNKTCFNGLYRVNGKNLFNVPIGRSASMPKICDVENLNNVSKLLDKVEILNGDYSETLKYATDETFFYFDPPYKPLSSTSSFNAYAKDEFNDTEQIRLKEFCDLIDSKGHDWIVSNSDVKGADPNNNFFDELYSNNEKN